jgi:GNAT superfamily N-acetyltransferase
MILLSEKQKAAGLNDFLAMVSPALRAWWNNVRCLTCHSVRSTQRLLLPSFPSKFFLKLEQQLELSVGKQNKFDNWALSAFGIRPDHQHKGIGSALMASAEAKVNSL